MWLLLWGEGSVVCMLSRLAYLIFKRRYGEEYQLKIKLIGQTWKQVVLVQF
jgi:hypothetical protein